MLFSCQWRAPRASLGGVLHRSGRARDNDDGWGGGPHPHSGEGRARAPTRHIYEPTCSASALRRWHQPAFAQTSTPVASTVCHCSGDADRLRPSLVMSRDEGSGRGPLGRGMLERATARGERSSSVVQRDSGVARRSRRSSRRCQERGAEVGLNRRLACAGAFLPERKSQGLWAHFSCLAPAGATARPARSPLSAGRNGSISGRTWSVPGRNRVEVGAELGIGRLRAKGDTRSGREVRHRHRPAAWRLHIDHTLGPKSADRPHSTNFDRSRPLTDQILPEIAPNRPQFAGGPNQPISARHRRNEAKRSPESAN